LNSLQDFTNVEYANILASDGVHVIDAILISCSVTSIYIRLLADYLMRFSSFKVGSNPRLRYMPGARVSRLRLINRLNLYLL